MEYKSFILNCLLCCLTAVLPLSAAAQTTAAESPAAARGAVVTPDAADIVSSDAPQFKGGHLVRVGAPFLEQIQERDSILIADQLLYGVNLDKVEAGTQYAFPPLNDSTVRGIMFLRPWQTDTLKTYKAKKDRPLSYDIRVSTVLTTFDEGEYEIGELPVGRLTKDGVVDTLLFDSIRFKVMTMPVDTTTFQPHDIKDIISCPLTAAEVLPWVGLFYLIVLMVIAAVCLVKMHKKRLSGELERKDPAHIVALRRLDGYRGDKLWVPEKQKQFYSGVTDVLREYIAARYGIGAMEMTTSEIFRDLKPEFADSPADRKALLSDLENLFETADYVKFAKHTATEQENASVLPLAVRFVTQTYQDELASQEEEKASQDDLASRREQVSQDDLVSRREQASQEEQASWEGQTKDNDDRSEPVSEKEGE